MSEIYAAKQARTVIQDSYGPETKLVNHVEEFLDLYYYFLNKQQ